MTEHFDTYKVEPTGFWQATWMIGGGYDVMEVADAHKWAAISAWGKNGWDLGSWPLVVIYFRNTKIKGEETITYDLAYNVEGDVTMWRFPTKELRNTCTDELAFWHWKWAEEDWVKGIESAEQMPDFLRGPFSWKRADEPED
jgi:hypothetical protein